MHRVEIRLLGGFGIIVDGGRDAATHLTRRDPARLVKLLAVTPGHRLARGDRAAVLCQFEVLVGVLDRELGVGPSVEARAARHPERVSHLIVSASCSRP